MRFHSACKLLCCLDVHLEMLSAHHKRYYCSIDLGQKFKDLSHIAFKASRADLQRSKTVGAPCILRLHASTLQNFVNPQLTCDGHTLNEGCRGTASPPAGLTKQSTFRDACPTWCAANRQNPDKPHVVFTTAAPASFLEDSLSSDWLF